MEYNPRDFFQNIFAHLFVVIILMRVIFIIFMLRIIIFVLRIIFT